LAIAGSRRAQQDLVTLAEEPGIVLLGAILQIATDLPAVEQLGRPPRLGANPPVG
jgi:hypothetical protein